MELYIHYPFCSKKCNYCDFLSAPASSQKRSLYMEALTREISVMSHYCENNMVDTVFIGGGTPSLMSCDQLYRLMTAIRQSYRLAEQCEITIEANPGTLTREFVQVIKDTGINRLSLGLQSADDRQLELLGRIHRYGDFFESFQMAREAGIKNINVDLMSALPGQTLLSWKETLCRIASLSPEHISAYSLIIEEGTPFYEQYAVQNNVKLPENAMLPDEDTERLMYIAAKEILSEYGYHRYEISNYARQGFECRHNIGYWRREDYIGFGLGASSFMEEKRFDNTRDFDEYVFFWNSSEKHCKKIFEGCHKNITDIGKKDAMAEFMFLGLRLTEGVFDRKFIHLFGQSFMDIYGEVIERHCREGLLHYIEETGQLYLTDRGIDLSNYVLCDFV